MPKASLKPKASKAKAVYWFFKSKSCSLVLSVLLASSFAFVLENLTPSPPPFLLNPSTLLKPSFLVTTSKIFSPVSKFTFKLDFSKFKRSAKFSLAPCLNDIIPSLVSSASTAKFSS